MKTIVGILVSSLFMQETPDGVPEVSIRKPESGRIDLVIEAAQRVGPYRVGWICADIRIEIDGAEPFDVMADENGTARLPLHKAWALSRRSSGSIKIRVVVKGAQTEIEISREESDAMIQERVRRLRGEPSEASALEILDILPLDSDALFVLAKARDAQGNVLGAVLTYREYLISASTTPDQVHEAKARAIADSKKLAHPLPIPKAAIDFVNASIDALQEEKWGEAYEACRAAQKVAPWWSEAYSRAAIIQAQSWTSRKLSGEVSLEDFDLTFAFGDSLELRGLYDRIVALKKSNDEVKRKWDRVKEIMDQNKETMEKVRQILKEGN